MGKSYSLIHRFTIYISLKLKNMKSFLTLSLHLLITSFLSAQAPQGVPYQAVVRNTNGSVLASTALTVTFMIHDVSASGNVVYQESQSSSTNAQGLVACVVGTGTASMGVFDNINWGGGAKFLHVLVNFGNGDVDMGTQQMLSVPYANYSNNVGVRISSTGDTLTIGKKFVIVPGISASNPQGLYSLGNGVTDINGNFYSSIIISGQEWMMTNLKVTQYRNGDVIPTNLDAGTWQGTTSGAASNYDDLASNVSIYGKLYNWYAANDSRGVCPSGWHVPTDSEWSTLETALGGSAVAGKKMKEAGTIAMGNGEWLTGYDEPATNESGFSAQPAGYRYLSGTYNGQTAWANFWTSTETGPGYAWDRELFYNNSNSNRVAIDKHTGFSVRCLKD
jgi:uncharacterized protein (TIGR02145 family)